MFSYERKKPPRRWAGIVFAAAYSGKSTLVHNHGSAYQPFDADAIISEMVGWPKDPDWRTWGDLVNTVNWAVVRTWSAAHEQIGLCGAFYDDADTSVIAACMVLSPDEIQRRVTAQPKRPDHSRDWPVSEVLAAHAKVKQLGETHGWPIFSSFDPALRSVSDRWFAVRSDRQYYTSGPSWMDK